MLLCKHILHLGRFSPQTKEIFRNTDGVETLPLTVGRGAYLVARQQQPRQTRKRPDRMAAAGKTMVMQHVMLQEHSVVAVHLMGRSAGGQRRFVRNS